MLNFLNLKWFFKWNPVAKCCVTGLCVNVLKPGRLSECILYIKKEHLKDEKEELGRIAKL